MLKMTSLLAAAICLSLASAAPAQNWPSFRGPGASGIAEKQNLPDTWDVSSGENIRWYTEIAGVSHASPVVWGDRVYVITVESANAGFTPAHGGISMADDDKQHAWKLLALNKADGRIVWQQVADEGVPAAKRHLRASHANASPATDGRYVVAIFGSQGMYCFDASDGRLRWQKDLGLLNMGLLSDPKSNWGYASSPIIFENTVIVQCDKRDDPFIAAFELETGEVRWQTARDELNVWSTPAIYRSAGGVQIVTNGGNHLRGYDARTGEPLWHFADYAEVKTPTPVVAGDVFYLSGGYPPGRPITAIRATARGTVTPENGLLWQTDGGSPYTSTPIVYRGLFYTVSDNGILSCHDAETGERLYRTRLGGNFSASPVAADGRLYFSSHEGVIHIVKAGREFEEIAKQQMGAPVMATPAISDATLLVRTRDGIYAIGETMTN